MWAFFVRTLGSGSALRKVEQEAYRLPVHDVISVLLHKWHNLCVCFPDCSITKFLNRILGLEVHKQNHLFQYFTDNFDYLIEKDKKEGKYDMGILGMVVTSRFLLNGMLCHSEMESWLEIHP